jgi:hypothetical protein
LLLIYWNFQKERPKETWHWSPLDAWLFDAGPSCCRPPESNLQYARVQMPSGFTSRLNDGAIRVHSALLPTRLVEHGRLPDGMQSQHA